MRAIKALVLAVLLLSAGTVLGQQTMQTQSPLHRVGGAYFSTAYTTWAAKVVTGSASGSGITLVVAPAIVSLQDGYTFSPWSTAVALTIDSGAAQETATPSAVASVACPAGIAATGGCETLTITTSNAHNPGAIVVSGSGGLNEATLDAGNNGGGMVYWESDGGTVTLGTGATTTTVCTACIPINGMVLGVVARVTTTITSACTGWELGDGTTAARFTANNTTLTAGTVSAADTQTTSGVASTTTGMLNITSAKNIVNTCAGGNPGAGAMHVHAFGYLLATPNF